MILGFILFLGISTLNAQVQNTKSDTTKHETLKNDIRFYGGLVHQHQDFFNKAFSFQGVETGVMLNHSILAGVFGAMFVSNLDATVIDYPNFYINIRQAGLFVGNMINAKRILHTGWQLNAGCFSLTGSKTDAGILNTEQTITRLNGLVLSPQFYAELNINRWMKLRTGLSYCMYSFEDQSMIKNSNLNNVSLSFGFIFGKFN